MFTSFLDCCNKTKVTIPEESCSSQIGQIVRMFIQDNQTTAPFADTTALGTQANWVALLGVANNDPTKIFASPRVTDSKSGLFGFRSTPTDPITEAGGDDTTLYGIPVTMAQQSSSWEITLYGASPEQIEAYKTLLMGSCNISVYFADIEGRIYAYNHSSGSGYGGIPIFNVNVADLTVEGAFSRNYNRITANFEPNWDTKLYKSAPTTNNFILNITN